MSKAVCESILYQCYQNQYLHSKLTIDGIVTQRERKRGIYKNLKET